MTTRNASSDRGRRLQRLRGLRHQVAQYLPFVVGICVVALLFLGYIAARGYQANRDAYRATLALSRVDNDLREGNTAQARQDSAKARRLADEAERYTGGVAWGLAQHVPGLRGPTRSTRAVATAVDSVARRVVAPAIDLSAAQAGAALHGLSYNLAPLESVAPTVTGAHVLVDDDVAVVDRTAPIGLPPLDRRIAQVRARLADLARHIANLDSAAQLAPTMLADGRRYLVLIQNNGESRATGGVVGAYALVHVANSALVLDKVGPIDELHDASAPVVRTDAAFERRYAGLGVTSSWRSLNLTPDFPVAAQVASALWQRQGRPAVDGVFAIDPPALASLLDVTGGVRVAGGPLLTGANVVAFLESGAYAAHAEATHPEAADAAANRYLAAATTATFDALRASDADGRVILRALAKDVSDGHLQIWSEHTDEESLLARTRAGGALVGRGAPYLEVVTQNLTGGKVDFYLRRDVSYVAHHTSTADDVGSGPTPMEDAVVTVRLTNTAPSPIGADKLWVSLYLAGGTGYTAAAIDGIPLAMHTDIEDGASVISTVVAIGPGQTRTLVVRVVQPAPAGAPFTYVPQPLAVPDQVAVRRD
ncbi:MAG TPA: DUF4012 domain-containing protein [Mycobacteriales bacterium]|nr:DUF4012 domain-containing protein [Mycobacteriales bacterium]